MRGATAAIAMAAAAMTQDRPSAVFVHDRFYPFVPNYSQAKRRRIARRLGK